MTDILVRATGLTRIFGNGPGAVTALAEATFEVRSGDKIGLVGPSGSGKTSLLHLIAALDVPSAGVIEWPALGRAEDLRPGPVAIAFQGPSLLPPLTVEENVALPLLLAGESQQSAIAAARAKIEALGLSEIAAKLPEEISGGQAQRAGLARALAGRPSLLLADEPTGQLDRQTAADLMDLLLKQVDTSGAALIVATHDMAVAEALPIRWTMNQRRLETGAVSPCSR
jgi:ABC-type lipoprotein export system ATPase subunit